jgi:hypothetical protein
VPRDKEMLCFGIGCRSDIVSEASGGDLTVYSGFQNPGKLTLDNVARETQLRSVIGARIRIGKILA